MPAGTVLSLFADCPLPACRNVTADGGLCGECQAMMDAGFIREAARPEPEPMTAAEAAETLRCRAGELASEAARKELAVAEWKPGQVCWVCAERRKCHLDPDFPIDAGRWICRECEAVPA